MAFISKGAELVFNTKVNTSSTTSAGEVIMIGDAIQNTLEENDWAFPGLQEIGAINIAGAGGSYDQIEVTTLADNKHKYVDGLIADASSNSNQIACKFLYDPELFKAFNDILDVEMSGKYKEHSAYAITIPENGGYFAIEADIASVQMESITTNNALTFTVTFAVHDIEMVNGEFTANEA